ncbi:MAG: hypothetical protein PGN29_04760 [Gordonia paraffinivorans]
MSGSPRRENQPGAIGFRPLTRADFPMPARWLADERVHRWWFQEHDDAALERDFGPQIDGTEPGEDLVVEVAANGASWRALEKAGFTIVASGDIPPDNPADDPRHHVLRRTRTESC